MIPKLIYYIRRFFRGIGNRLRTRRTPPDYVVLELSGDYPYFVPPPSNFIEKRLRGDRTSLRDLQKRLQQLAADERITGVVLHLRPLGMGASKINILRREVLALREAGKHTITYAVSYDRQMMYLASATDLITVQPSGLINPLGIANQYQFFADTLAKVGLQADVVAISPYKSAGDTLARSDMSEAVREMSNWLLDSAHTSFLEALAAGRGVNMEQASEWVNNTPCTDLDAMEMGLLDAIINEHELLDHLKQTGDDPATLGTWDEAERSLPKEPLTKPGRKGVAIIEVDGLIIDGESQNPPIQPPVPIPLLSGGSAGDKTVVQAIRAAARNEQIEAIVLWVNSRGGSATASEAMAAALQQVDKPIVAGMGQVAASGGYYVATPAQWIVAEPTSIVGSIGVISAKIATVGLLDMLDVGWETLKRGDHADWLTSPTPFDEEERARMLAYITRTYEVFLNRVMASRSMTHDDLDLLAGGRVWTGEQALEHGLIDALGGMDAALSKARELAGLEADAPAFIIKPDNKHPLLPKRDKEEKSAAALLLAAFARLKALNEASALTISPMLWGGTDRERWY